MVIFLKVLARLTIFIFVLNAVVLNVLYAFSTGEIKFFVLFISEMIAATLVLLLGVE